MLDQERTYIIPAGSESTEQSFLLQGEDGDEDDTSMTMELLPDRKYRIDPERSSATFIVTDDDPEPTLSVSGATASEGAGEITFQVSVSSTVSPPSRRTITVDYATRNGTAVAGEDFTAHSGTLTIQPQQTSATIVVPLLDNGRYEQEKSFTLELSNPVNAVLQDAQEELTAEGTITDDGPLVSIAAVEDEVDEGDEVVVEFTRTGGTTKFLRVYFYYFHATYAPSGLIPGTVGIPVGQSTVRWSYRTVDDDQDELDTSFFWTLVLPRVSGGSFSYGLADASASVTIKDNDLPVVTIEAPLSGVTEGQAAEFTLTRDGLTDVSLTVNVIVTETGDFLTSAAPPSTVTFAVGSATTNLSVPTLDDSTGELHGSVSAAIDDGDYRTGDPARATISVADNDRSGLSLLSFPSTADRVVPEGTDVTFVVARAGGTDLDLVATVRVGEQKADSVSVDGTVSLYDTYKDVEISFAPGDLTAILRYSTEDETVNDGNSRWSAEIILSTVYHRTPGEVYVWVQDDDIPTVSFAEASVDYTEESEGPGPEYTLVRTGDTSLGLAVQLRSEFVARSRHYGDRLGGSLNNPFGKIISPGESTRTYGTDPTIVGPDGGTGYVFIDSFYCEEVPGDCAYRPQYRAAESAAFLANVHNNAPGIEMAVDQASIEEGEAATFTLVRYGGTESILQQQLIVRVAATQDGEFIEGTTPQTVTFAGYPDVSISQAVQTVTLTLTTVDDEVDEPNGSITLTILPASPLADLHASYEINDGRGGEGSALTVAVADNETPIISIADASASESDGIVEFTVTATAAYEELTVNWKTSDGTATPGSDYTANSGKVVFNEGETSKTIRVNLIDDSTAEGDETFIVTLSNPTEAVLSSASAVGTIEDDDALFVLTVTTSDGDVEEGEPASITFSRGPEEGTATSEDLYSDPVKIRFKLTQQGDFLSRTEEAFGDVNVIYNETTGAGSLIMPGGQPDLTLNLTTVDDSQGEYDGSITLTLTPSTNSAYIVGQPGSATVNVSDNDVGISIADAYADEGDFRTDALGIRGAFFTVSLSRAADAEVTVFAWTVDGTATSGRNVTANSLGRDYYSRSERLVFQPGETEVVFEVLIAGDTFDESETEFFTVSLDLANVEILDAEAVGRISDDDKPLVARVHRESRTVDEDAEEPVKFRFELTAQEGSNTTAAEFSTAMLWTVTPGTATAGEDYVAVDGIQRTELQVGEVSKTAEVSLIDDSLFEAQNETFTFTMTESIHAIYSSDNQAIEITIRDDDEMQAAVAAVSENALEGDDASLTVTLSPSLSTAPVEVIYAVVGTAGSADYVTPSGTLTIPAGESSGTVTISTLVDNIPDPGETLGVQLTRATSNGREITIPPRGDSPPTVTILDHRTLSASIIAGEPADEGDNVEFTVSLSVTHSAPVHVDWATSDGEGQAAATGGDDYTSASGSVTIPVGNKAATFTVATLVDNLFEGDETFIARLTGAKQGADPDSATSINLGVSSATGTIADNNPSPTVITLTVTPESVSEGAGETELSVTATLGGESRLPHDLHVVTPLVDSLTIPAGQASGTGALTFTPEDDEIDEEDRTETIEGLAPGFNVIPATFTITDDDDPPTGVNLTVAPNAIGEGAGKTDLTVTGTLTGGSLRSVDTQVTLSVGGVSIPSEDDDGDPSTAAGSDDFTAPAAVMLTIPAGQRTGTATVTFTPTNDIVVEGDETAQVSGDSGDLEVSTAVLTIEDDDDEPDGIRLSMSPAAALEYTGAVDVQVTATLEGGGARLVATTLLLSVEDVTATVGEDVTEPLDVSLTIPAGQLSGVATLSISLVNDNIHEGTEEVAIRGTNEDPGLPVTGARFSITDDDEAPTQIVLSIDRAEVSEGGGPQQRQVTAEFQGSRRSVGTLLSLTLGEGTAVAHDYSAFAATLIIPAGKQQGVATMVIFPTNDYVVEGDETAQIRGSTSLPDLEVQPAFVTITDDDTAGLTITPAALVVSEGSSGTYMVVLDNQPSGDVTVTVSGQAGTDLTLSGLSAANALIFTTTNWFTAQTVTVTSGEDSDGVDGTATLTHTAAGGKYAGTTAALPVTVADDDRGIVITPSSLSLDEGDATGVSYTVKLATEPSETVTITVSGQADTDLTLTGLSAANTLTFTADNWDTGQPVTVTAGEDADGVDDTATLTHTAAGGEYAGKTAALPVTVNDNDRGLVLSRTSIDVDEGDATGVSYTIELATQPTEEITVTVSGHSGTDLTLTGLSATNTLTFTADNWDTVQRVTVKAGEDADGVDDTATLIHTAAGGKYEGTTAELAVTVTDNDRGLVLSRTSIDVEEGDATGVSYTVELATQPTEEITVTVTGHSGTDLTLSGLSTANTLTFTTTNWDTGQPVTVTAGEDSDGVNDTATLIHTATRGEYAGTKAELAVTVTDNDRGSVLSRTSIDVEEGDATGVSYTVKLATQPTKEIWVTVSGHSGTDLTLTGLSAANTLTFTTSNWAAAQRVTVTAGEDSDGVNDTATLIHTARRGEYEGTTAALAVTVEDNDRGLVLSRTSLDVDEGDATGVSYTVELATQPTEEITVTVSGHSGTDLTLSGLSAANTLTFTTTNWAAAQRVTVTAGEDSDGVNDTATLIHTARRGEYEGTTAALAVTVEDNDRVLVLSTQIPQLTLLWWPLWS